MEIPYKNFKNKFKQEVLANYLELNSGSVYSLNRRQEGMCKREDICSETRCPKRSSVQ